MRKLSADTTCSLRTVADVESTWACGIRQETRTNDSGNPADFGTARPDRPFRSPQAQDSRPRPNTA